MTTGGRAAGPWELRETLVALFFAAFVLVQVAVPLFQLTQPRPTRFGWQMYSTVPLGVRGEVFVVEQAAGGVDTVHVTDHVVRARWDIDYRRLLPPHLCDAIPDAAAILFQQAGTTLDRHPCR